MYLDPNRVPRQQVVAWRSAGSQNPFSGNFEHQQPTAQDEVPINLLHRLAGQALEQGWV